MTADLRQLLERQLRCCCGERADGVQVALAILDEVRCDRCAYRSRCGVVDDYTGIEYCSFFELDEEDENNDCEF